MKPLMGVLAVGCLGFVVGGALPAAAAGCPADSVRSGTVCIDKYENSVWQIKPIPPATTLNSDQKTAINKIQQGTVTLNDLNKATVKATQLGLTSGDLGGAGCDTLGANCTNVYAVSIAGVAPAAYITWFQATAAARNSLKELPSSAQWQQAALGTPDPDSCNTSSNGRVLTGSQANCVSSVGAFDMVGNIWEWIADWQMQQATSSGTSLTGQDSNCGGGPLDTSPSAGLRGGSFQDGATGGVYSISWCSRPDGGDGTIGFRSVRANPV